MSKFLNGTGITYLWKQVVNFIKTYCASNDDLDRIKYYGDKDIVPSDESYFTVSSDGTTITGLTDAGKTQTSLVIPYKIDGKKITKLEGSGSLPPPSILDGNNVITKIIIPNSVSSIGDFAFIGSSLTSINIPNSVTSIGMETFYGCSSLTSINIPNGITSIGDYDFVSCSSLISINIPDSVSSIGGRAFYNCTSLTSVNIPNSVTSIAKNAFENCSNLTIYCEQGSYAETYAKANNIPVVYTDVKAEMLDGKVDKTSLIEATAEDIDNWIGNSDTTSVAGEATAGDAIVGM